MMMTVQELAAFMKVSSRTVRRWLVDGLPFVRVGQVIRIDKDNAMGWIERQKKV
jgi:excisionase family DNA binding protein